MKMKPLLVAALSSVLLWDTGCKQEERPAEGSSQGGASDGKSPATTASEDSSQGARSGESASTDLKKVASDVLGLIGKDSAKNLTDVQWRQFKQRYWQSGFDRPISNTPVSETTSLTGLLKAVNPSQEPLVAQVMTRAFKDVSDPKEQEALVALHYLAMVCAGNGGHALPAAVNELGSEKVVTRGDAFLYELFLDAFVEVGHKQGVSSDEFAEWTKLSTAENPLSRLIALRTFPKVSLDAPQTQKFFESYSMESNHEILTELMGQLFQSVSPESLEALNKLQANQSIEASQPLKQRLQETRVQLEKVLSARQ